MILNYTLLGQMSAEFKDVCRKIDKLADDASGDSIKGAFAALLDGDVDSRDRLCDRARRADDARQKAKVEAWLRIGEKYGIDRDTAMQWLKKIGH